LGNKQKHNKTKYFTSRDINGQVVYFKIQKHIMYGDIITPISRTAFLKSSDPCELQPIYETQSENIDVTPESPGANVTESTTEFTTVPLTAAVPLPKNFIGDFSDWGVNDIGEIKSYLAKPQRYSTFAWAATNVLNDQLLTIANMWSVPSNITPWVEKLRGYYALNATLCFSFQINASPFTAGRIRAAYYPAGDDNPRKASIHFTNAIPFSQLPGVEIDCSHPTATLKIPYITPHLAYEMTATGISWGRLDVRVVAPFRTDGGNPQTLNVVMWTWLEDVELIGQTNSTIVTQSMDIYETQAANPSEDEVKPFTRFFRNVAQACSNLSDIPLVSAYTGPVQWAAQIAAGICSAFGWSKPLATSEQLRVHAAAASYSAASTGTDTGSSFVSVS
jgi:hypothetical protein